MKQKLVENFVVFVIFPGAQKKYLTGLHTRPNNSLLPAGFNPDVAAAKTWNKRAEAEAAIKAIFNVHDRKFEIEPVSVPEEKKVKILNGKAENEL